MMGIAFGSVKPYIGVLYQYEYKYELCCNAFNGIVLTPTFLDNV